MKKAIVTVVLIIAGCLMVQVLQDWDASTKTRAEDTSSDQVDLQNAGSNREPNNRVVGLISDGKGGSRAVCFDCDTWKSTELMDLPKVTPDNYVALSPDSKKLAYTTWDDDYARRYLVVYDNESCETIEFFRDIPVHTEIIKISWMPDGETLLYIRNDTTISSFQTIELMNIRTGSITVVDQGEVWKVRTATDLGEQAEDFYQPGSKTYLPVKYAEPVSTGAAEQWNYYLDTDDIKEIYQKYGGVREFDFSSIQSILNIEFSAPRCSRDGKTIIYSTRLERNSAPGERTPLWVAAAIWAYDVAEQKTEIIYKQADAGAIGRVDWVSDTEICFVSYYDYRGSRDNVNYYHVHTGESHTLFHYTDEYYNNVTLLPIGGRKISFTSSGKDDVYENSRTYSLDIDTGAVTELDVIYRENSVILENFIFD